MINLFFKIEDVTHELEEVKQMAADFENDLSQESEGGSLELLGSQVGSFLFFFSRS